MKPKIDAETFMLIQDLRNALGAAMRVIARNGDADEFIAEAKAAGVQDGIGIRINKWLEEHRIITYERTIPRH